MKSVVVILLGLAVTSAGAQSVAEERAILDLSKRKFTWMVQKNLDSLSALLDDGAIYMHSNGWRETKKDFLDNLRTNRITYSKMTVDTTYAVLYPKTAIVHGKGALEGVDGGEPYSIVVLFTEVYVKNRKWSLVLRTSNRLK